MSGKRAMLEQLEGRRLMASISGYTFNDGNGNGLIDGNDVKIGGKTVFLDKDADGKLDTGEKSLVTKSDGSYSFTGLSAGTYHVRRVFPSGYTYSTALINVTVTSSQVVTGKAIGSKVVTTTPVAGSISWSTKASEPQRREESTSFTVGGKLYVVSGYINSAFEATRRVERYDPATNTWTRMKDAPTKLTHGAVAVEPGTSTVWIAGGFIGDFPGPQGTNVVWKYNAATDTWTRGADLPVALGSAGAGIIGRTLYVYAGASADRTRDLSAMYALNLDNTSAGWSQKASLPDGRSHFGSAVVNGKLYAIGGQHGLEAEATNKGEVYVYTPSSDSWKQVASMPRPMSHFSHAMGVYKNRYIIVAGGESPHNVAAGDVSLYDTVTDKWTKLTNLPSGRRTPAGGIIGNTFVVSGGYNRTYGMTNNTWTADLSKLGLA